MSEESRFKQMLAFAKTKEYKKFLNDFVAVDLQKAIRAEAGAMVGNFKCVVDGQISSRFAGLGEVICVTCGDKLPWSAPGTHAGHFLGSRSAGIVLEEVGIHPQCFQCNDKRAKAGNAAMYQIFMQEVYGEEVIYDLTRRRHGWYIDEDGDQKRIEKLPLEELVKKRIGYNDRWKAAQAVIDGKVIRNEVKEVAKKKTESTALAIVDGRPRQMQFEFDYEDHGFTKAQGAKLDSAGVQIHEAYEHARYDQALGAMTVAKSFADAKKLCKENDLGWGEWLKSRGFSRSTGDKACRVWQVFGKTKTDLLAGIPISVLYKLTTESVSDADRKRVLEYAKTHHLTESGVRALLPGAGGSSGVSFNASAPSNHDELKEYLTRKCNNLAMRVDDGVKDEFPEVLREIAEEWEATGTAA